MRISDVGLSAGSAIAALALLGSAAIAQQVVPVTPESVPTEPVQVQPVEVQPVQVQPVQVQPVIVQPVQVQPVQVQPVFVRPVTTQVFTVPVPLQPGSIPYRFEQEFFSSDGNYFQNRTFLRQLAFLFGPFPENQITRDAREVNQVYREVLSRQLATGPLIRTADLPSPFTQTTGTLPVVQAEIPPLLVQPPVIERPAPIAPPEVVTPPAPVAPAPVPALW
jgi:hypothetical protein